MKKGKESFYCKYIKRILDIICALTAMIMLCWLYAIIAILVRVKLGSPVIFKQVRPGKDEKFFYIYKFRSMTDERDADGKLLPDEMRLTKFGKWLRGTSLDEIPEAWNILKGDMSVVGPRPQLVRDMVFMTPEQRQRHFVRPGLSGLAQVSGRNAIKWDHKLAIDLEYVQNVSFLLDAKIVITTVKQVFFHTKNPDVCEKEGIDLVSDYGDFLMETGQVSKSEYEQKQIEALQLLSEGICVSAK